VTAPSRPWVRALVVLLVLLALFARESKSPHDRDAGVAPLVTDPDSAWHLRRIALSLSASRLAQSDRFLSFPDAAGNTDLPVFDELMALLVRVLPVAGVTEEGAAPDEERLEGALRSVGPALAVIWLFFLYRLMRKGGGAGVGASLIALALIAFSPIAVEHGAPGRLHVEALAGVLFAIQLGALLAVWRCPDPMDRMLLSIVAGFVTGLGLATSPLFLAPLLAGWVAWVAITSNAVGEERQNSSRAALLFWICAMLVGQVTAIGGPWLPASSGPVAGWAELLQVVFLVGAAPLLLLLVVRHRPLPATSVRVGAAIAIPGLFVVLAAMGPEGSFGTVLLAALGRGVGSAPIGTSSTLLGPEILWVAVFLFALVRGVLAERGPETIFVSISGLLALVAALLHPPAVLFFAAPAGLALARILDRSLRHRSVQIGAALLLAWCASTAFSPIEDRPGESFARAALWLRRQHPAPGPWNSATAIQRDGILCDERAAPLFAWYAHRACATTGARRAFTGGERGLLERVLTAPDEEELARRASVLGVRYLVLGPGSAESLSRLGADPDALESLRLSRIDGGGLRTIHTSGEPRVAVLEVVTR